MDRSRPVDVELFAHGGGDRARRHQPRSAATPLADRSARDLVHLLDPLAAARGILLAVSGGPDSTALMHLAAAWRRDGDRPPLDVACVNHGLRPDAHVEADAVVQMARSLGLAATVLRWTGDKPTRGIPARARAARYSLLSEHARAVGASHIVTAHTLDDQAETVLMRLARGSGLAGLGAMRPMVGVQGLTLARPFLDVVKRELVALCDAQGWRFFEDPSNHDPAYARVRWRKLAATLEREGLSAARLALLARRFVRADTALARAAEEAGRRARLEGAGVVRYDMRALAKNPEEVLLRVVAAALLEVGASTEPRLERLERLAGELGAAFARKQPLRRTLGGCLVRLEGDVLAIAPEGPRRRGVPPPALQHVGSFPARPGHGHGASLGKPSPASYIAIVDATARTSDTVETHGASGASAREPMLSAGPQ